MDIHNFQWFAICTSQINMLFQACINYFTVVMNPTDRCVYMYMYTFLTLPSNIDTAYHVMSITSTDDVTFMKSQSKYFHWQYECNNSSAWVHPNQNIKALGYGRFYFHFSGTYIRRHLYMSLFSYLTGVLCCNQNYFTDSQQQPSLQWQDNG